MKQYFYILIAIVFSYNHLFAIALDEKLDELINYKNVNKGVSLDYNPFVSDSKIIHSDKTEGQIETTEKKEMKLLSIINQKAFISGKWYSVGDIVDGNKIIKINHMNVEIKKEGKMAILAFDKSKNLLNIKDSKK